MRRRIIASLVAIAGVTGLALAEFSSVGSAASPARAKAAAAYIPKIVDVGCTKSHNLNGKVVGMSFEVQLPLFSQLVSDVEKFAKLSGCGLSFKITNANGDPAKQVTDAQGLVTDKVNAVFTNVAESPGWQVLGPLVKSNHTVWYNWSSVPEPDATAQATVWQAAAGALVAAPACAWLKKHFNGKAEVAMLVSLTDPGFQARSNAFKKSLLKICPKAQFVATGDGGFSSPSVGEKSTLNLIQAHPNLKMLFADWDGAALGAVTAARESNKTDPTQFYIASTDGSTAQLQDMAKPGAVLQSTGALLFRFDAGYVVRDVERLLLGQKVPLLRVLIPELVTTSNLKKFDKLINAPFSKVNENVYPKISKYFSFRYSNTNQLPIPAGL